VSLASGALCAQLAVIETLSIDGKDNSLEITRKSGQREKENDGCNHVGDSFSASCSYLFHLEFKGKGPTRCMLLIFTTRSSIY
jgi:hypothetical protein